ncbi:adenylate/guanylate cyclase domain-containing protein [Methylobacterium sp. C25]|uniref:adenylate/guanylate cyclase domain-containing protein n=1 Tax=Methylobacterium sp. C25 TaxID=2721622 RepID=UPI001F245C3A|nr:adenylate/guanylate cyclase domain-containing protein [Methylobacterium sp. C25]MCE4224250.1 adenylate/guanylate cyclase domain-containing protein [Methylobacterium sp. C25]
MDQDRDGSRASAGNGEASALRLLQSASGLRLFAMHALIVVVLLATAQSYDGSIHPMSHWVVLAAYATCSLGLGLAERWDRDAGQHNGSGFTSRRAEGLAWASTALNAGVAIYVEIEHLLVGASAGFDDAAGAVSKLPAFLLLLQTGLTMRVWHTAVFAGAVAIAWAGTILIAILQPAGSLLGPHVSLSDEMPALLTFIAASLVVIDGVRRLRHAVTTALRLEHERTMLARFVPGSVAVQLAREGGLGTVRERHACLFTLDIRGFSAFTRDYPREHVVQALLDIRALTHAGVSEHGGIVDKYIGDGVLAHFLVGPPQHQARSALDAAVAIRERLDALNVERREQGRHPLTITIALHAGTVLAGVFDDGSRAEFTALGSAMNMLARLEARAKAEDLSLAASEQVIGLLVGRLPSGLTAVPVATEDASGHRLPALYAITQKDSIHA